MENVSRINFVKPPSYLVSSKNINEIITIPHARPVANLIAHEIMIVDSACQFESPRGLYTHII